VTRYVCVDDQKAAGFPVTTACEAAGEVVGGGPAEPDGPDDAAVGPA
jgi:hypothetical protein